MTTCNGCGDCCERVYSRTVADLRARADAGEVPPDKLDEQLADIAFMEKHWTQIGSMLTTGIFTCDQFDSERRTCMAYDDRPPVCRGYPGFGRPVTPDQLWHFPRCEFWADVPAGERPPGWQPVLLTTKPV